MEVMVKRHDTNEHRITLITAFLEKVEHLRFLYALFEFDRIFMHQVLSIA